MSFSRGCKAMGKHREFNRESDGKLRLAATPGGSDWRCSLLLPSPSELGLPLGSSDLASSTPERDQPGYAAARRALSALAAVEELRCTPVGRGTVCDGRSAPSNHDRIIAQCFHAKWGDIAGEMIARGHACDLTQFSGGHYARERGGRPCFPRSGR